uniref:F-box domain-containing protein n=1 Tax=Steinernema glaseri TaxID=37863 RepID=A0A1I7ZBN4_9BILA
MIHLCARSQLLSPPSLAHNIQFHNMDRVCASFYEDVIGLLTLNSRRNDLESVLELSGRWSTVAKRHEKKQAVYRFILTQDSDTNAWKYRFYIILGESFSFAELKERQNWRFCQVTSVSCYRGTPDPMYKEVSESDLFSVLLPFVSSRLCRDSSFYFSSRLSQEDASRILRIFKGKAQLRIIDLFRLCRDSSFYFSSRLSQEDASRILRIFEGKGQLRTIDLLYYQKSSERFLESHVAAGGSAVVTFTHHWPESTKDFILNYAATTNSRYNSLPSSVNFGTEILDVMCKRWKSEDKNKRKILSIMFSSDLTEEKLREHCQHLLAESERDNFILEKELSGAYMLSYPRLLI